TPSDQPLPLTTSPDRKESSLQSESRAFLHNLPKLTITGSSLASSKPVPASDTVKSVSGWPSDVLIDQLDCRNPQLGITILDLAIAASQVHKYNETYRLLNYQCYWYSDAIVGVLEEAFQINRKPSSKSPSLAIEREEYPFEKLGSDAGGTWNRVPIYERKDVSIKKILRLYKEKRDSVDALVNF